MPVYGPGAYAQQQNQNGVAAAYHQHQQQGPPIPVSAPVPMQQQSNGLNAGMLSTMTNFPDDQKVCSIEFELRSMPLVFC